MNAKTETQIKISAAAQATWLCKDEAQIYTWEEVMGNPWDETATPLPEINTETPEIEPEDFEALYGWFYS